MVLLVHLDPLLHFVLVDLNDVLEILLPAPQATPPCKTTQLWEGERLECHVAKSTCTSEHKLGSGTAWALYTASSTGRNDTKLGRRSQTRTINF